MFSHGEVRRRKDLAIMLERIPRPRKPKLKLEQYVVPGDVAAYILWEAALRGDIRERIVVDLGSGTGRLGIGALILGASHVICVDIDVDVLRQGLKALRTLSLGNSSIDFVCAAVPNVNILRCDTVIMNPPFGVHKRHADVIFLESAFKIAHRVYSLHKYNPESEKVLEERARQKGFDMERIGKVYFPIQQTYPHHYRRIHRVLTAIYRFAKT